MARDQITSSSRSDGLANRLSNGLANRLVNGVKKVVVTNGVTNGAVAPVVSPGEATPASTEGTETASNPEDDGPIEVGTVCDLKKLYSGKEDKKGRFVWQDTIPEDIGSPVENSETAKYALLVRNVKVYK